jgi:hypothetical protein
MNRPCPAEAAQRGERIGPSRMARPAAGHDDELFDRQSKERDA